MRATGPKGCGLVFALPSRASERNSCEEADSTLASREVPFRAMSPVTGVELLYIRATMKRAAYPSSLFVVLEAANTVKAVEVDPSSVPDADSVHDEARLDMHLREKKRESRTLSSGGSGKPKRESRALFGVKLTREGGGAGRLHWPRGFERGAVGRARPLSTRPQTGGAPVRGAHKSIAGPMPFYGIRVRWKLELASGHSPGTLAPVAGGPMLMNDGCRPSVFCGARARRRRQFTRFPRAHCRDKSVFRSCGKRGEKRAAAIHRK
ncbi:hypothetical protein HPB49_018781 [Dermacentor silvarum]|uniref:Uncharacterized protein n=1 Tax=Dermacentor silvarum TaxID=543639 RepID=A0ACB8E1H4_DERSI|nr:hypothetical protein HPB49_018781 [Dermacentor silvarum]